MGQRRHLDLLPDAAAGFGAAIGPADPPGVGVGAGRRANEALDVLRLLWAGDDAGVHYDGEFFSFSKICIFPKPYCGSTLPIHIDGSSPAAARRAGLRGDRYFPGGRMPPETVQAHIDLMREVAAGQNRDPQSLDVTRWGSTDMTEADVEGRELQRVTGIVVSPGSIERDDQRHELETFAVRHQLV